MKKLLTLLTVVALATTLASAQNLETIIKKSEKASGAEKMNNYKSLIVKGTASQMGMAMNMTIYEKKPDKMKTVIEFQGSEIVTLINGDRGYMINPMMGSADPVELPMEQIAQQKTNRMLGEMLSERLKEGKLELVGEEEFGGKPSFKIKAINDGNDIFLFVDKKTYLMNGTVMEANNMGQQMTVEARMLDYKDFDGVQFAMKIETYMGGTVAATIDFTEVKFNTDIDDSVFEIK